MKQEKYLKRAIDSIGIVFGENEPQNEKELDGLINEMESLITTCEDRITEFQEHIVKLKEAIETGKINLDNMNLVKRQIVVEQYKDLNPKAQVY